MQSHHIVKPTAISKEIFDNLWRLAQSYILTDDYSAEIEFLISREIGVKHKAQERKSVVCKSSKKMDLEICMDSFIANVVNVTLKE